MFETSGQNSRNFVINLCLCLCHTNCGPGLSCLKQVLAHTDLLHLIIRPPLNFCDDHLS